MSNVYRIEISGRGTSALINALLLAANFALFGKLVIIWLLSFMLRTVWFLICRALRTIRWLHRAWLLYPVLAVATFCYAGHWIYSLQTALDISVQQAQLLASENALLNHEKQLGAFANEMAKALATESSHTREFNPKAAKKDALTVFASNGAPLKFQSGLISIALSEMEAAGWPREAQLLYLAVLEVESGFNPLALNKKSSAAGANQFIASTGKRYGLSDSNLLEMETNVRSGLEHFRDNWVRLFEKDLLVGFSGIESLEHNFELLYKLHHDGPNTASREISKAAMKGAEVGKKYIRRAYPVIMVEAPVIQEPENLDQIVTELAQEVVTERYSELEQQLRSTLEELLKDSPAEEWLEAFPRLVS